MFHVVEYDVVKRLEVVLADVAETGFGYMDPEVVYCVVFLYG